ncbi:MAG TPA: hypothetical protein DEA96_09660 [Leptospiraceae bacterium]|nr:hypothetical protein [Spirochaetaceae bacterium]HBS05220.1 hypothetical protein [Leptospiraceae bacterium]|tara:strand:- start:7150 stop:7761 length:612 start_codon:yes stop_codon:yes gene_type:complete
MGKKSKIWGRLAIALLAIVMIFLGLFAYMGGFSSVQVSEVTFGPHTIIYATHRGPYEEIGSSWEKFQSRWEKAGLKECKSLAIYLDPPDTPPEKLRSILGCNVEHLDASEQEKLAQEFPVFEIPAMQSMRSEFPYRNMLSFMLGPIKVYPEFQKVMEEKKLQPPVAFEIYGDPDHIEHIEFIMPMEEPRTTFAPLEDAFESSL